MNKKLPTLVECAVLAYCLWQSLEIIPSWFNTPFLRMGWLAFLLWAVPLIVYWCWPTQKPKSTTINFFWIALALSLAGTLGSLNALKHIGLAFAFAGLVPFTWMMIPWFLTSVTWMPAMAYFAKAFPLSVVIALRIVIAIIGMICGLIAIRRLLRT